MSVLTLDELLSEADRIHRGTGNRPTLCYVAPAAHERIRRYYREMKIFAGEKTIVVAGTVFLPDDRLAPETAMFR